MINNVDHELIVKIRTFIKKYRINQVYKVVLLDKIETNESIYNNSSGSAVYKMFHILLELLSMGKAKIFARSANGAIEIVYL